MKYLLLTICLLGYTSSFSQFWSVEDAQDHIINKSTTTNTYELNVNDVPNGYEFNYVSLDIEHDELPLLKITLVSPQNVATLLTEADINDGNHFNNTRFSVIGQEFIGHDEFGDSHGYNNVYIALDDLNDINQNSSYTGTWQLQISYANTPSMDGVLKKWSVAFAVPNGNGSSSGGGSLAVDLADFQAHYINNKGVQLDWMTYSELDNKGFSIQRSTNAQQWEEIAYIDSKNEGIVNTKYQFIDPNFNAGIFYYRLIDQDNYGKNSTSEIKQVNIQNTATTLQVYPNPIIGNNLQISTNSPIQKIQVFNAFGQLIETKSVNSSFINLNVSNWESGSHWLKITLQNGEEEIKKIVR